MKHTKDGNDAKWQFEDVSELLTYARNQAFRSEYACARKDDRAFTGTNDFAEAEQLASAGWPEGLEQADKLRAQLVEQMLGSQAFKPRLRRDVSGFSPCAPAAIAGDPENMFSVRRVLAPTAGRVLRVMFNNDVSGGISHQTMIFRGAVVLAVVDLLEASGIRCEINLGMAFDSPGVGPNVRTFVPLKRAEDALNRDTLAFWCAHPASFRRIHSALGDNLLAEFYRGCYAWGRGRPDEFDGEDCGDLYLCGAYLENVNDKTAVPWLKSTLARFGVEFENEVLS